MKESDDSLVQLLGRLRKAGVEMSLMRNGTIQFTHFERVSKHDNALIGLYYADIVDYLKEQTPKVAKPKRSTVKVAKPKRSTLKEPPIPAAWLVEDEAAAFTPLGSVVIRPSPLSSIALRATFSGVVREKVAMAMLLSDK
jgi:hypothetical protein